MHRQQFQLSRLVRRQRLLQAQGERERADPLAAEHDFPQRVVCRIGERLGDGLGGLVVFDDFLHASVHEADVVRHRLRHGEDKAVRARVGHIEGQRPRMAQRLLLCLHEREHLHSHLRVARLERESGGSLHGIAMAESEGQLHA